MLKLCWLIPFVSRFDGLSPESDRLLVLLRHKFLRWGFLRIGFVQHGHLDSLLMSAVIRRRRIVAIEFGTCRSGRSGGASGSVTLGKDRCFEERGGTRR